MDKIAYFKQRKKPVQAVPLCSNCRHLLDPIPSACDKCRMFDMFQSRAPKLDMQTLEAVKDRAIGSMLTGDDDKIRQFNGGVVHVINIIADMEAGR